jgi:hypothetical protein
MITRSELRRIARARLRDAEVLFAGGRYDGAVYLCGYAVEVVLKARICRTLRWDGFPSTSGEFASLQSFRTHNLEVLLSLTGQFQAITSRYPAEWLVVTNWSPEFRYNTIGTSTRDEARRMIDAARVLLGVL